MKGFLSLSFCLWAMCAWATEFKAISECGKTLIFEADPQESLQSFLEKFEACAEEMQEEPALVESSWNGVSVGLMAVKAGSQKMVGKQPVGVPRVYEIELNQKERKDIRFILTTLANNSLPSIWQQKGALERAGDRIDHVHPLRFIMAVFTDEELKVAMHNIKGRSWVWNEFFQGMCESLSTEMNNKNLKQDYINDFSKIVGIDPTLITAAIYDQRWSDFVDILIVNIPRNGNPDRYDM